MASFDFGSVSAYKFALNANVTANTNTAAIDTQGFEGVAVVSTVGAVANVNANATITVAFREGNDTNVANSTVLAAGNIISNGAISAANTVVWASVRPTKRYLYATYIVGTNLSANIATTGALGYPNNAPTQ